ncbi:hypothetical protein VP01_1225g10 [Puccinia sorghi]|uniref:Uncharacterized protein n=1 Tax=Puccinia sorghi TaxID=27349 RepID=A0A0L6VPX8_9BASI|nr:hypothetical protein VP01_1225g10 [Puccinia sorghi]
MSSSKNRKISSHFIENKTFNNKNLYQIMSSWLLKQEISFHYCELVSSFFKKTWADTSGKMLIWSYRRQFPINFQINKFNLIHYVWKTKGNCFKVIQLGLKLVSWHHKGSFLAERIFNILNQHQRQHKISIFLKYFL